MNAFRRWQNLPADERRLTLRALPLVVAVRAALTALPWPAVRRGALKCSRPASEENDGGDSADADAVCRAVARAARRVPRATCLTQAIAAGVMLGRRGVPVALRLGLARGPQGAVLAHAWLERDGRVLIGGADSPRRYAAFPAVLMGVADASPPKPRPHKEPERRLLSGLQYENQPSAP